MASAIRASVIIPAWNGAGYLPACLDALLPQLGPDDELIVVDNASTDDSAAVVQRYSRATLIASDTNRGFAGGCNLGLAAARGEYLLLLNQDVVARRGWLDAMLAGLAPDPAGAPIGIVGSKLLYPDGTIQHAGAALLGPQALPVHAGYHEPDQGQWDRPRQVGYVTGAAMGLRRATLEAIGPFDEGFAPAFYEEADLCERCRAAGLQVRYVPAAVAVHREGSSLERESTLYHRYMGRGRLRFVLKHTSLARLLADFVPAEAAWLAAQTAPGLRQGLRLAYLDTLAGLEELAAGGQAAALAAPGAARQVAEALQPLAALLDDTGRPRAWPDRLAGMRPELVPPSLGSRGLRGLVRGLAYTVATGWYVRPLIEQQTAANQAMFATLADLRTRLDGFERQMGDVVNRLDELQHGGAAAATRLDEHDAALVDADREVMRLRRELAALRCALDQAQKRDAGETP